jgi:hypothetical protein
MKNTIVHDEGAASLEVAVKNIKLSGSVIKIGLDVHARLYVAVAQVRSLAAQVGAAAGSSAVCAMGKAAPGSRAHRARGV